MLHVRFIFVKWKRPHVVASFLYLEPDALLRDAFVFILFLKVAMVIANTRQQIPAIFVEPVASYREQLVPRTTHAHDMVLVVVGIPFVELVTTRIARVMQLIIFEAAAIIYASELPHVFRRKKQSVVIVGEARKGMSTPLVADANNVIPVDDGVPREVEAEVRTRLIHHLCDRKSRFSSVVCQSTL